MNTHAKSALLFWVSLTSLSIIGGGGPPSLTFVGNWVGNSVSYADIWADGDVAYIAHFGSASIDIVDISDPTVPTQILRYQLPPPSTSSSAQDVKVGDGLLFIGLESAGNGVHIVDVRDPLNPQALVDVAVPGFNNIHNVFYKDKFLYMVDSNSTRVAVFDLRQFDPDNPPAGDITAPTWQLDDVGTDIVHDITVAGGRLYACAWDSGIWVYDVSDIANQAPVFLGSGPGNNLHSAWPTDDGKFVITGEERSGGGIAVFRMDDDGQGGLTLTLTDQEALPVAEASSVHNQVTIGNRVYNSWYGAGLRIYDVDPIDGTLDFVANYDTAASGSIWGVYPFLGTDRILLSGLSSGLTIVRLDESGLSLDLNQNGSTEIADLVLLRNRFGPCAIPDNCPEDLNGNGHIDHADLSLGWLLWGTRI